MPLLPRLVRALLALAIACVAWTAGPEAAGAAVAISTPDRCYVYWPEQGSQSIPVALTGLLAAQGVKVELRVAGVTVSGLPSLTADGAGAITARLDTWTSGLQDGPSRGKPAQIVVSDSGSGALLASAPIHIGNVGLAIDTSRRRFGTKRRWVVSGLSRLGGTGRYWAFYFHRGNLVGKQSLGRPKNDCGYLVSKQLLIPFRKVGKYELRVQASRRFRPELPWIGGTVEQGYRR